MSRKQSNQVLDWRLPAGDVCGVQQQAGQLSAFTERDSRGHLPLHAAALRPQTDVLRVVLQGENRAWGWGGWGGVHLLQFSPGVPVTVMASTDLTLEEQTGEGDTPLTLAAAAGLVDNVRILLGHGASPHNTNSSNESPLLIGTNHTMLKQQVP